jgi:hypothetical protein
LSALDKVLRLAQPDAVPAAPDAADLVRMAAERLDRIALLLAKKTEKDPDGDGDDDSNAKGDTDHDFWTKGGKKKKPKKKGKAGDSDDDADEDDYGKEDDEEVAASRRLVLEAMVALSQVEGGEFVSLSVLTMDERRKPAAHTIGDSTDYPIPDKVHLAAAVARYKQGKFAGHSQDEVRRHIMSRARALGEQVDLAVAVPAATTVITLARGFNGPKFPGREPGMVPMDHGPHTGTHSHPHRVVNVHDHEHMHNGDSRHSCGEGTYPGSVY